MLDQVVSQAGGAQGGESIWGMLLPIVLMFAIIYFLMIRPQQKQAKQLKTMLEALKRGDQVVTNGGLIGRIFQINEGIVTLEVADGVRIRVLKGQIASTMNSEAEPEKKQ
jgi:preprotein translocase subunit YajC